MSARARDFAELFVRELDRLRREVEAFEPEATLWVTHGEQKNPPGTLVLHLCGNLRHYVGAALGGDGYVRDREGEFSRCPPRAEILDEIDATRRAVEAALRRLDDEALDAPYPGEPPPRMQGVTTHAFLAHLLWHLGWHLGQIYYARLACREARPSG